MPIVPRPRLVLHLDGQGWWTTPLPQIKASGALVAEWLSSGIVKQIGPQAVCFATDAEYLGHNDPGTSPALEPG